MRSLTRPGSPWPQPRCDSTVGASACATCSTTRPSPGGPSVRCDEIALLLPEAVDANRPVGPAVQEHIESCLRCQAELARYRRMLRSLQLLRTQYLEPAPGLLGQTLAAIGEASEQHAIRSLLNNKRVAYAGAIGGALAAAGATAAIVALARS